jgi:hypothetical protein
MQRLARGYARPRAVCRRLGRAGGPGSAEGTAQSGSHRRGSRQWESACAVPGDRSAALAALALRSSADPARLRYMTAQHHEAPAPDGPAETPAAIRAALAATASTEVLRQYDAELDAAFAQARETGDLTVLITAVRRWWIEALEWRRDPAGQRAFLARMERYLAEGPPGPAHRIAREEFRAQLGV